MSRSTILTRILGASMVGVLLAGCLALPQSDRTMFQEPLLASKGTLPLKAGLMTLTDARPAEERGSFPDIEDFPDRITLELLMDLSEAQLFSSIGHDSRGADVILGERSGRSSGRRATTGRRTSPVSGSSPPSVFPSPIRRVGSSSPSTSLTRRPISGSPRTRRPRPTATRTGSTDIRTSPRAATGIPTARSAAVVEELQAAILADGDRIVAAVKR